ncbi:amidase [cf. Phormidesmis sp. LEGE 11477]|uniref:amidase n=1 Tax=cf. Phormidesmis sp. LEGE 11477 TaxID=1828680 RepID=UPI00187F413B|nr:amidase [cf. Phormidesmis sp. LEGE 11477]MBE9063652.1 amidase [cf. Phormidesmis sp. LEGE 11477]
MKPLYQWSATELRQKLNCKDIRATEIVQSCLQQIEQENERLKAFITTCAEPALSTAQAIDEARSKKTPLGPLSGIPFSAKDLTPTAGIRTTLGSLLYRDWIPVQDELCVARLKQAGGVLMGKTNTPEFGLGAHTNNPLYGPTANPYDSTRSAGGSSGGAAVAIATGMCALSQGTDMGGSVRTPASFCGVVGLRPAAGRIPRPRKPLLYDVLDTDGIIARTVEDTALMLSVMAGWDAGDPMAIAGSWSLPSFGPDTIDQLMGKLRVGFSADLGIATIDSQVKAVFKKAVEQLSTICDELVPEHPDCSMAPAAFETLRAALLWYKQKNHYEAHYDQLTDTVRWNVERGKDLTAFDILTAAAQRDQLYRNFLSFFETHDVLVTVSACIPPFPHKQAEILSVNQTPLKNIIDYLTITYTISLTGLPVLSIPCGWTPTGLPIGMQLIGPPQGETLLLQFAYMLQETLNFSHRWPAEFNARNKTT